MNSMEKSASRPNFLVFMTDHQRGDTLLKSGQVKTPNLDKFRKTAVNFTEAYCTAPHCCPSRASFFTGLFPSQHGVWNNVNVGNRLSAGLYDNVRTFSEDFAEAGYNMLFSGKWHVSAVESPEARGFKTIAHNLSGYKPIKNQPDLSDWAAYNGKLDTPNTPRGEGQVVRDGYPGYKLYGENEHPFGDDKVVDNAIAAMSELSPDDEQPFFMYVGVLGPHDPYNVPKRFLDMYDPDEIKLPDSFSDELTDKPAMYRRIRSLFGQLTEREQREGIRSYYAFCSYEDYLFGKLVDSLAERGLDKNTVIVYCSDHGDYVGEHGLWTKGLPCFREAYNICAMIGGEPIAAKGTSRDEMVSICDFAPTFLELAGIKPEYKMWGRSLAPFLRGETRSDWRNAMFTQTNGNEAYGIQRSVTTKKWKYVFNSFDFDELYDLEADPHQLHNLIYAPSLDGSPYREVVRELCRLLWGFEYETNDVSVNGYIMTAMCPFGPGIIKDKVGTFKSTL